MQVWCVLSTCIHKCTMIYRANPLGINFLIQSECMPSLAGEPVACGAPHAAMLCQQTAPMPSICSVTYIKFTLLSLSPQHSEPCLATHLPVQACTYLCLGSVFLLCHQLWWAWLTTGLLYAMTVWKSEWMGEVLDKSVTRRSPRSGSTQADISLGFYFPLLFRTLYQFACPWPANWQAQTHASTGRHAEAQKLPSDFLPLWLVNCSQSIITEPYAVDWRKLERVGGWGSC